LRHLAATEDLPSERGCREILLHAGVTRARVAHSEAVAAVAAALTAALDERGWCLCLPLVVAAALLHDVARAEPRHGVAGAELLERLGHARVARVVRHHMRLGEALTDRLDETQVVYLADKLVQDDRLSGVEARFAARLERWADDTAALRGIRERLDEARLVQARVEAALGRPLSR
jgi:HD superfamily phosphohydrolase YqeK